MSNYLKWKITLASGLLALAAGCSAGQPAAPKAAPQQPPQSAPAAPAAPADGTAASGLAAADTPAGAAQQPAAPAKAAAAKPTAATGGSAAAGTAAGGCREHPLAGVAGADKLEVKEACATFTGIVQSVAKQPDSTIQLTVKPDKEFVKLLNAKNTKAQSGNMPIEILAADAKSIALPKNGAHVLVTGAYVLDKKHGWTAFVPVWKLESKSAADAAKSSAVTIVDVTSPVRRGEQATVKAKVPPGTIASIAVHYRTGTAVAAGLEAKKADSEGNVSWTWKVTDKIAAGKWPVTVTTKAGTAASKVEITS